MTKNMMSLIALICLLHACDEPITEIPATGGTQEELEAGTTMIIVGGEAMAGSSGIDTDGDGLIDTQDNCPSLSNPN